ncbi:MAG: helix-turn-helix domain-containing protein [Symploca sp. SIO3C6]|uniref:Helix-turn-helix domain-containing protein n=1 Tax=Symploca sp. SIO1C4 TaxID=2607765 RepID=A0A6B3N2X9_9CYAN|nr:helix-turn-helix domain-containing protein [Symploca sp. SIO3C6]NER27539.1 helix-turn-helix domain-containing protein [Symploca sp. SIO1C4]NET06202.1 helix-turn-helix domain-containing protein [Symploca sp. SIO2B6]
MNSLNPTQAEQLHEIGAYLRRIREEKSISTEQVASQTYISLRILKALEAGQLEQLPEPVFIQGFIRRYGDFLRLDGEALAKSFPVNVLPIQTDASIQQANQETRQAQSKSLSLNSYKQAVQNLTALRKSYILYMILLVAAVIGLLSIPKTKIKNLPVAQQQTNSPTTKSSSSADQKSSQPATTAQVTLTKSSPQPTPKASQPNSTTQVSVTLQGDSWLRVTVDGKTEFEGILTTGDQQTWKANQRLTLRAGNAGAVLMSINGQQAKPLGKIGGVQEVTFSVDQ